ncbi:RHS repeat domain-containing protein, partial [Pedobacter sp. L105]|uniref:RHS repeat domain-containing protein n=1 Tax=Pedobacter sp. L105 TaxID=1641871 RepID=UPI002739CFA3
EKKIPGIGWQYLVYNKLDKVVLTRDANQTLSTANGASFIRYDAIGRTIMTGTYSYPTGDASYYTRPNIQALFDAEPYQWEVRSGSATGYTAQTLPEGEPFLSNTLTINYYDDYNFPGGNTYLYPAGSLNTRGLLTGTKTLVLGTSTMLLTLNYYDDKGRLLKVYQQHYQSGAVNTGNYDEISYSYNFENAPLASTRIHHNVAGGNTTIATRCTYDHMGRRLNDYEQINTDAEVLLANYNYNEIGQLTGKGLDNGQQQNSYAYNERGWVKSGTSAQFSFQLNYQDGITPQFNGNISGQLWGAGTSLSQNFAYNYDQLNRLKSGIATGMSEILTYDVMGNIKTLNRNDTTRTYVYNGNQLTNTTGGPETASYQYDLNGNATVDGRSGRTVTYNFLNLPTAVSGVNLTYVYDGTGRKLKKISNGNTTDYIGGIQYTNGTIDFIQTEAGLARNNGASYSYEYNLTDHLGNVRYSFHNNPVTGLVERLQSDDYFAFGLRKSGSPVSLTNKYLYNGKELQDELGDYDYGARQYDPVIGRWNVADALAESAANLTP